MFDIQMDGIYLDNGCLVKEAGIQPDDARENTIAYQILRHTAYQRNRTGCR